MNSKSSSFATGEMPPNSGNTLAPVVVLRRRHSDRRSKGEKPEIKQNTNRLSLFNFAPSKLRSLSPFRGRSTNSENKRNRITFQVAFDDGEFLSPGDIVYILKNILKLRFRSQNILNYSFVDPKDYELVRNVPENHQKKQNNKKNIEIEWKMGRDKPEAVKQ